jgi:hypothetical protein
VISTDFHERGRIERRGTVSVIAFGEEFLGQGSEVIAQVQRGANQFNAFRHVNSWHA